MLCLLTITKLYSHSSASGLHGLFQTHKMSLAAAAAVKPAASQLKSALAANLHCNM